MSENPAELNAHRIIKMCQQFPEQAIRAMFFVHVGERRRWSMVDLQQGIDYALIMCWIIHEADGYKLTELGNTIGQNIITEVIAMPEISPPKMPTLNQVIAMPDILITMDESKLLFDIKLLNEDIPQDQRDAFSMRITSFKLNQTKRKFTITQIVTVDQNEFAYPENFFNLRKYINIQLTTFNITGDIRQSLQLKLRYRSAKLFMTSEALVAMCYLKFTIKPKPDTFNGG